MHDDYDDREIPVTPMFMLQFVACCAVGCGVWLWLIYQAVTAWLA